MEVTSAAAPAGGPLAEPVSRVSPGWMAAVAAANLGLFMAYFGPLGVLLPDQVQAIANAHRIVDFSLVSGLGAVVAIVVNPLAGALSDRTVSRFGRRRPWILGGSLLTAVALCLVGRLHTVPEIVAGWCLAQVGVNAMQAGLAAVVPDRVPVGQRGGVSGWIGIAQTVSVVAATALVTKISGYSGYLLLAVAVVALALPFVIGTADPPLPHADRARLSWRVVTQCWWPARSWTHDFRWAWLTRFLLVLGNAMAVVYLLYFLRRIGFSALYPGHTAEQGLVILLSLYAAAVVGTTVIAGRRSDRTGRRRHSVAIAGGIMAAAALLVAAHPGWSALLIAAPVLGVGFGLYLSIDQALVTQVLPSAAERATSLGMISVASSAAQASAPAIAAPVVTYLGGFSTLYVCVAVVVLLGSASVCRIRSVP
ncbi:MAG TPA: MFS transporter [Streptosporangiaceae bacterium]|nr:MFS transporter [Streptosporangiaceae bacterium]